MKTKIVYIITSNGKDHYVEQALMSIWSCKHYNPDAKITVVADKDSQKFVEKYKEFNELVSEFIYKEFESNVSKMVCSRILKTTLRNIISGDFLFVDTDTIFCDSIGEIDNLNFNIALVEDLHFPNLKSSPFKETICNKFFSFYKTSPKLDLTYFNSGVIFAKDTKINKEFYQQWNKNWNIIKESGYYFDQLPLLRTVMEYPNLIHKLDPRLNAQIFASIKYLSKGKILHFFNYNKTSKTFSHPFFSYDYYLKIKDYGLSTEIKSDIVNCKELFLTPTIILGGKDYFFWVSNPCSILKKFQDIFFLNIIINSFLKLCYRILLIVEKIKKSNNKELAVQK